MFNYNMGTNALPDTNAQSLRGLRACVSGRAQMPTL